LRLLGFLGGLDRQVVDIVAGDAAARGQAGVHDPGAGAIVEVERAGAFLADDDHAAGENAGQELIAVDVVVPPQPRAILEVEAIDRAAVGRGEYYLTVLDDWGGYLPLFAGKRKPWLIRLPETALATEARVFHLCTTGGLVTVGIGPQQAVR